jgi:TM2 domain-containing membrane protein YozV
MDKAQSDIDFEGRGEDSGVQFATGTREGVEQESRRRNPFSALGDALKRAFSGFGDQRDELGASLQSSITDATDNIDLSDAGEKVVTSFRKGVDKERKRRNPFSGLLNSVEGVFDKLTAFPSGKFAWATVLGLPAIGGAAKLIAGVGGGLVSILANVATAAAGAGVALGGLAATGVPAILAIKQALSVQTEALDQFNDDMAEIAESWQSFGAAAQESLLPALEDAANLLTDKLRPGLTEFSKHIGESVAVTVRWAAAALTSKKNLDAFGEILANSQKVTDAFGRVIIRLADVLPQLFAAAAPIAADFAETLDRIATRFQDWVNETGTAGLADKFDLWWERAKRLGRIISNVADALGQIFSIGADASDPLLNRIERITQEFQDWARSLRGRRQIATFFENALPVLREVAGLFGDIIKMIGEPILTGDTGGVVEFIRWLREEVIPMLGEFAEEIRGIGLSPDSIKTFVEALLTFTQLQVESGATQGFIDGITGILNAVSRLLAMPDIGPIAGKILYFAGVLKAFKLVTGIKFTSLISGLINLFGGMAGAEFAVGPMAALGGALAAMAVPLLVIAAAAAAFFVVWKNWDTIVGGLQAAWEWFTKLNPVLRVFVGILAGFLFLLLGPLAAGAAALLGLVAALKNFAAVKEFVINAAKAIGDFFTELPDKIGAFLAAIPGALETAKDAFLDFAQSVPGLLLDFVQAIPGALAAAGQAFTDFAQQIPGFLLQGLSALGNVAAQLGSALGNLLLSALASLANFGAQFGQFLLTQIVNGLQALPGLAVQIGQALLQAFIDAAGFLTEWAVRLPAQIFVWVMQGIANLAQLGIEIVSQIVVFLAKALPAMTTFFVTLPIKILNWIVESINKLIPVGARIIATLVKGLIKAAPAIARFFLRLPGQIIGFLEDAVSTLFDIGVSLAQGLLDGIISLGPQIITFFQQLPGNILRLLGQVANFLFDVGHSMIDGLWQGIQAAWDLGLNFLTTLPSRILTFFSTFGSMLVTAGSALIQGLINGATSLLASLDDLFAGLPGRIGTALVGLGTTVLGAVTNMVTVVIPAVAGFITQVVSDLAGLPAKAFTALAGLAGQVLSQIASMASQALTAVATWITNVVNDLLGLPGQAASALATLASSVLGKFTEMVTDATKAVTDFITDILTDIAGIPVGIVRALVNLGSSLLGVFTDAFNSVLDGIETFFTSVYNAFLGLADLVLGALGNFASDVANFILGALKEAVNIAIRGVNAIIRALPSVHIPGTNITIEVPTIPEIGAMGLILTRPTLMIGGEAGAEALIPLTRPQRALQLMNQTGLTSLVLQTATPTGGGGEVNMVKIENATFTQPVDLDLLLAKVPHVYNVMTGRR